MSNPSEVLAFQHRRLDLIAHSVPAAMSNIARYANLTVGPHASIPYPPMQGGPPPTRYQSVPIRSSNSIDPHRPPSPSHFESPAKWSVAKRSRNPRRSTNHAGPWSNGTAPMPATALGFGGTYHESRLRFFFLNFSCLFYNYITCTRLCKKKN
jgi:hypothetical protein